MPKDVDDCCEPQLLRIDDDFMGGARWPGILAITYRPPT